MVFHGFSRVFHIFFHIFFYVSPGVSRSMRSDRSRPSLKEILHMPQIRSKILAAYRRQLGWDVMGRWVETWSFDGFHKWGYLMVSFESDFPWNIYIIGGSTIKHRVSQYIIYIYVYIYTYIHIHIYIYTYIYICRSFHEIKWNKPSSELWVPPLTRKPPLVHGMCVVCTYFFKYLFHLFGNIHTLIGGLEHEFYDFPYIGNGITNPTDELHHFSEGWLNHQPDTVWDIMSTWEHCRWCWWLCWWPTVLAMLNGNMNVRGGSDACQTETVLNTYFLQWFEIISSMCSTTSLESLDFINIKCNIV